MRKEREGLCVTAFIISELQETTAFQIDDEQDDEQEIPDFL